MLDSVFGESTFFVLRTKSFIVFIMYRQSIATEEQMKEIYPFVTSDKKC